jgi:preprotein translocase subunit SecE
LSPGAPVKAKSMVQKKIAKTNKPAVKSKARAAAAQASGNGPASWWDSSMQFLREVKTELKKVTWPNKKQTVQSTGVVLVLVGIVAVFLGVVDWVLAYVVKQVVG